MPVPLVLLFVVTVVFFAWLASRVTRDATMHFDLSVRGEVHTLASGPLTDAMLAVTQLGSGYVLAPAGVFLFWRLMVARRRRAALLLAIATIGAEVLDLTLKLAFHRLRPDAFFGVAEPVTYSFPSGHSIMSCAFYGAAAAILTVRARPARKAAVWVLAVLLIAAIGFSRVYLGVHYPTDVLGGYDLGVAWLAAVRIGCGVRAG